MTQDIAGLPYWEIDFDKDGRLLSDDGLRAGLKSAGVQDLFVFAHGWNSSVNSARDLYRSMFTLLAAQLSTFAPDRRARVGVVGVLWPSLLFPEDDPTTTTEANAGQVNTGVGVVAALAPAFPSQEQALGRIGELLDAKPQDPDRLEEAHKLIGGLITTPDPGAPEDAGMGAIASASTSVVFGHLASLTADNTGAAQGIGNIFSGLWHGAREALRVASYFEMKNRAGVVGQRGLGPLLAQLQDNRDGLRVHLLGHSFGGRLAAFALAGLPDSAIGTASPVKSLLLLQAAFSHFTFADPIPIRAGVPKGHLAGAGERVDGPLFATFSAADLAVGRWYPAASMINGEDAESADDLTYRWGAMGHDGFQQAAVIELDLQSTGQPYTVQSGSFCRLRSDAVIAESQSALAGAHSDIRHDELIWVALSAALG